MFSCPPAINFFEFPALILWKPETTDLIPEPHTWLTTYAGTSFGTPAFMAACLAGFWPEPPVKTWPNIISSRSAGFILVRLIDSDITAEPKSSAFVFFKDLPSEPTAVLTAEVI